MSLNSKVLDTRLNGRQTLAAVLALDSIALSYAVLVLLLSDFDGYDMFILALYMPHIFTVLLNFISVHYFTSANDVLGLLVLFFWIAMTVDLFVFIVRLIMLFHSESLRNTLGGFVRIALALLFIFIDLAGALCAGMTRAAATKLSVMMNEKRAALEKQLLESEYARGTEIANLVPPV